MRPPEISKYRSRCRGLIQASGSGASASAWVSGLGVPYHAHARDARPHLAPVRPPAPRHAPVLALRVGRGSPSLRGKPRPTRVVLRSEEAFAVEDLLLAQQVVDGATQPRRQGPQGAGLAVLLLPPGQPTFGRLALAEQQAGRLRESPFEMGVADLVPPGPLLLAGRFVSAADQPSVGQELTDLGETTDIVDLIEENQRQHRADAGDRAQAGVGLRIVHLGGPGQVQFDGAD